MGEPQPPPPKQSNKFNAFVRKSVDKASSLLKPAPSDKKDGSEDLGNKKEHRRAQVRKAQIEHRQRKENHIKTLEQEIINLRDLIDDTENQSRQLKLENTAIKNTLNRSTSPVLLNNPISPQHHHPQTTSPGSEISQGIEEFVPTTEAESTFFEYVASVGFDELMNVSYLQLSTGNDFPRPANPTSSILGRIENMPDHSIIDQTARITANPSYSNYIQPGLKASPVPNGLVLVEPMHPSYEDPEVALKAINFILALEHPCRTHFLPRGTLNTSLPVLPADAHSGHELMASTYLYTHAPIPVFQNMKLTTSSPPPTPAWAIPSSPTTELKKLYAMSNSLSKNDWEITPVQAWFLLVETLGTDFLQNLVIMEALKERLGKLVKCFGFGATMDEALFWGAVGEFEGTRKELVWR